MTKRLLATAFLIAAGSAEVLAQRQMLKETVAPLPTQRLMVAPPATTGTSGRPAAACTATTTLDFAQRTTGENWKNLAPVIVGGAPNNTTISTTGTYVEPNTGNETDLLVTDAANNPLGVKELLWSTDYTSQNNATTQITYSFNRPVNNLSLRIQDLDRNNSNFIDAVTLDAYQANGALLDMGAADDASVTLNTSYVSRTGNTLTGIQQNTDGQQNGTVTVTFNKPITSFTFTYRNTYNIANPGVQYIGIDYITWCTQANVATTLSGPARAIVGSQVTYTVSTTASGDYAAPNVQPKVQLSAGLNSQSPVFPSGSSYDNNTGLLTLAPITTLAVGATSTAQIKFNMPNATVAGKASSTIGNDDSDPTDNDGSLANANVTTTTNQAPTAQGKSATVSANTTVYTALPAMTGTDPNNDPLTYIIDGSSIGNIGFGRVYFTRNGVRTALTGSSNVTLSADEVTTLEFKAVNGAANGNTGTLRYSVIDGYGGTSNLTGYTITVADQPAVYTSPNIFYTTSTVSDEIFASVTDPDGTITRAAILTGTLPTNMLFDTRNAGAGNFSRNGTSAIAAGTYNFTVTTSNGTGGTTTAIPVTIRIIASDTEASYSTGNTFNRDALTNGSTLATVTDADGGVINATTTGTLARGMALNAATGAFTVNSDTPPFAGTYTYTVNTRDAADGTSAPSVTITINNDQEAAYSANRSVNRDALSNGSILSSISDADGAISSASISSGSLPAGTALNATTGQFTVSTASSLVNGTYTFAVSTVDATGGRSITNTGVTLFETEAVYAVAAAPSGVYTDGYSLASVSDVDGAINSASNSGGVPAGVGFNTSTGQFTVTNRRLLVRGSYPVQVTTTDATGGITTQTVTIVIKSNPLPVTLTSFTAQATGQDVVLKWATAQEVNNDHFVLERSFDGQSFEAVQQVKGQGTKSTGTAYAVTDAKVAAKALRGMAYYRLRQVDTDGTEALSTVQIVAFSAPETVAHVYPSPATSQQDARLDLTAAAPGTYEVSVTDLTGRIIRTFRQAGGTEQQLQVSSLPTGVYLIQVQGNGQSFNQRLVKE